jgi:hypothetical protein
LNPQDGIWSLAVCQLTDAPISPYALTPCEALFDFLVRSMLTAVPAEFGDFQPVGVFLLVLRAGVIPVLADRAF